MRRTRPLIGLAGLAASAAVVLSACSTSCPGQATQLSTIIKNGNKVLAAARLYSNTNTQQSFLRTAAEFDHLAQQIQNLNVPSSALADATTVENAMHKEAADARLAAKDFVENKIPAQRTAQQAMVRDDRTIHTGIDALQKDLQSCA